MTNYKKQQLRAFVMEFIREFRWGAFFATVILALIGFFFVFSATFRTGSEETAISPMVKQQIVWFVTGIVLYLIVSLTDYEWICEKSWILYGVVFALLVYVAIAAYLIKHGYGALPFTKSLYGATRWLRVAGFQLQPSEIAKLSCLLSVCYYLFRSKRITGTWQALIIAGLIAGIPAILIMAQPDLGTAMVLVPTTFVAVFIAGANIRYLTLIVLVAANVAVYAYLVPQLHLLKPHQRDRIDVFLHPEKDPLGDGWNLNQSRIAVGSGRTWGKGFLKGDVKGLGYLPVTVAHNDFIFAVYAEETGFVGGMILLTLYSIIIVSGIRVAFFARDELGRLLALGVTTMIFFHVFVNVGMTMGIMPITGVPLPLVSYGGTFMLVVMVCLGLIQSVWLHRKPY
jgi:rod shape determining protein RodA